VKGSGHGWISGIEGFVIPRSELYRAVRFDGQRSVTVQFQLVGPIRSFWQFTRGKGQHRFHERCYGFLRDQSYLFAFSHAFAKSLIKLVEGRR